MDPVEERLLAHRYLYYVLNTPVISDYAYDRLERAALRVVPKDSALHRPGSDRAEDYPPSVVAHAKGLLLPPGAATIDDEVRRLCL